MITPQNVIDELAAIRAQSERGVTLLGEAETKMIELKIAADRIELKAFLDATGTGADKTAISKFKALEAKELADKAAAEVSYIKTRLKQLSESQMAVQTSARMVELQWKTS